MIKCKFCELKVVEECDDEFGDCLEGCHVDIGDVEIFITKLEHGKSASLYVNCERDWDEEVRFDVGGFKGKTTVPTGIEINELFDIRFCPMCGKEL